MEDQEKVRYQKVCEDIMNSANSLFDLSSKSYDELSDLVILSAVKLKRTAEEIRSLLNL